jgi:hypothetical protein
MRVDQVNENVGSSHHEHHLPNTCLGPLRCLRPVPSPLPNKRSSKRDRGCRLAEIEAVEFQTRASSRLWGKEITFRANTRKTQSANPERGNWVFESTMMLLIILRRFHVALLPYRSEESRRRVALAIS